MSLRKSVADASSSSCGIERPMRAHAPLRNGAGEPFAVEGAMAGADDEIIWPLKGNDDLIAAGLAPKDDNDTQEDAAALFGLDGGGGKGMTATGTLVCSNGSTPSVAELVPLLDLVLVSVNLLCGLILMRSMRL